MNVEIGTEASIILFWEFLFQIFGILSLRCGPFAMLYRIFLMPVCTMYLYFLRNKYAAYAKVATVLGSIPASSDTVVTELGFPTVYTI